VVRIRDRYNKFVTLSVPTKAFVLNSHNGDATASQLLIEADIYKRPEQIGSIQDKVVIVVVVVAVVAVVVVAVAEVVAVVAVVVVVVVVVVVAVVVPTDLP
jgi:hypothetical protein